MSDPSAALQTAIYSALSSALSCEVYDAVPQSAAYPYVTLDYETSANDDFVSSRMDRRLFYLSIWSTYRGQKEVKDIMATIDTALHRQRLSLSTGTIVSIVVQEKSTNRDQDDVTYMGRVVLEVLTQH